MAIDAVALDMHALNFACYVGNLTRSPLSGLFLEDIREETVPVMKKVFGMPYVETIVAGDIPANKIKIKLCEENVDQFRKVCNSKGVNCNIQVVKGDPAKEIIRESRYCDLIIAAIPATRNKKEERLTASYIENVLRHAECPVIIAPESFEKIDEIVFTFDGNRSSTFAIKQFTHLFPQLADTKAVVLHVDDDEEIAIDEDRLGNWLKLHYASVGFIHLQGNASEQLFEYLLMRKNMLVVMGAYGGRKILSRLTRNSHAELILKTITLPVFIAHN